MLEVTFSETLDALAAALADRIAHDRGRGALAMFDRAVVVAPNREVATEVELCLARRHGIAANIAFPFLESFLANLVPAGSGIRVLGQPQLANLIGQVLADPPPEIAPATRYIEAGGDDEARARRRFQLCRKLASLFVDYRLSLPDLVEGWKAGPVLARTDHAEAEAWQRALWLAIFGPGGACARLAEKTGQRWLLLPDAIAAAPVDALSIDAPAHIIGFSILPPAYLALFARIATRADIRLYNVSPSAKLWDEVRADDAEASLLARWGAAGRATFRQLVHAVDGNVTDRFAHRAPRSLLSRIQHAFVELEDPATHLFGGELDRSIEVRACPSQRRELEVIAREIWHHIHADPDLRFCDIAVLFAGHADEYLAQVGAVFRDAENLPHHAVGLPLTAESRLAEAFEHIIALPCSRFTRLEVLRAITHPAVMARFSASDPQLFIRLTDELGIAHGADRQDHGDTYIEDSLYHWDWGIRRLALGALMDATAPEDTPPTRIGEDRYLPLPLSGDRLDGAMHLLRIARTLIADARAIGRMRQPLARWARTFERLATAYLATETDDDGRALERIREATRRLTDADITGGELDYITAREHMLAELSGLRERRGQYLADGVFVAPLSPMRPLSHRLIFCAGLTEGWFPSQARPGPLDLRAAQPQAAALSQAARDRYAFIETLMSARDRLILSYVARHEVSGEARNPASVLCELLDTIAAGMGDDARGALVTTEHHDELVAGLAPQPEIRPLPYAYRRAQARALRESVLDVAKKNGVTAFDGDRLGAALCAHEAVRRRFAILPPAPPDEEAPARERLSLSVSALRGFLEDPLQAWGRTVLRLSQDEDEEAEAAAVIDEPFVSERRTSIPLLRRLFAEAVSADPPGDLASLISRYREHADRLVLTGTAPVGAFAHAERTHHERWLETWHHHLLAQAAGRAIRAIRIGPGDADAVALSLEVGLGQSAPLSRVDIVGDGGLVIDGCGPVVLVHQDEIKSRHRLRALFAHVLLAATGILADQPATAFIFADAPRITKLTLDAWSQADAQRYLSTLITELHTQPHAYLFKGSTVLDWLRSKSRATTNLADKCVEKYEPFGPVTRIANLGAPPAPKALAEHRLEPLYERWRGRG